MPDQNSSLIQDAVSAARGVWALLVGNRNVASYFDFGQRGLVSSFLALLLVIGATSLLILVLGVPEPGAIAKSTLQNVLSYAGVAGATRLLLQWIGRLDAFVPFLVAFNWTNVVVSVLMVLTLMVGILPALYAAFIVGAIVSINIARLIMTLRPRHIAMLIAVQVVGLFLAAQAYSMIFPPSPEEIEAVKAALGIQPP